MTATPLLLVLGLQTGAGLRAVLVDERGFTDLGPSLVVPGARGWARLDATSERFAAVRRADVVARASGEARWSGLPAHDGDCDESGSVTLGLVSDRLVSFERHAGGFCGGAHDWILSTWAATTLDELRRPAMEADPPERSPLDPDPLNSRSRLAEWFGPGAAATLVADAKASFTGHAADETECFSGSVESPSWTVVHRAGAWAVEGHLGYGPEACRGMEWDFPTHLRVPPRLKLAESAASPPPPGALDWVAAPKADWRVEVRADALVLVAGGTEKARLPLDGEAPRVVQTDWAIGAANVARWRDEAAAAAPVPAADAPFAFATALRDGTYASWSAGADGLHFLTEGVVVGDRTVSLVSERPSFDVRMEGGFADQSLVVGPRGAALPEPARRHPEAARLAPGHTVVLHAVDPTSITYTVTTRVRRSEATAQTRRVALTAGTLRGDALGSGGAAVPGEVPAAPTTARSADGQFEATCTTSALELRVGGSRIARALLPAAPEIEPELPRAEGEPPPGDVEPPGPACRFVYVGR